MVDEKPRLQSLDEVLALQLVLSWAGETPSGPAQRLGWWRTDLVDLEGGGDLWKRLLPRTHRWAALEAARRAARLTDQKLRRAHARADDMVTLFHFGFHLDEALDERLTHHKLEGMAPNEVLPLTDVIAQPFDARVLLRRLDPENRGVAFKVVPGGRQLKRAPSEPLTGARQLASAMLQDNPKEYPLPFFVIEAHRDER